MQRFDLLLLGAVGSAALALTGCTAGGSNGSARDLPPCADVWIPHHALPDDYAGCSAGEGETGRDKIIDCVGGSRFATYGHRFYGFAGGAISEGTVDSQGYLGSMSACRRAG